MNQQKVGKFIAQCRKEKGYTQAVLAEKLGITDRAVSKWETGKCMPDVSIMLELCELLEININELLSGERITMTNYQKMAEENLIKLQRQEELNNKKLLNMEIVIGVTSIAFYFLMIFALCWDKLMQGETRLSFSDMEGWKVVFFIVSTIIFLGGTFYCVKLEHDAGYYECPHCKKQYVPTMKAVVLAPHIGRSRSMKCPYCNQKGYHKKVLTKESE